MESIRKKWLKITSSVGEQGVTLIELLAVVVILAIIAAIAIPVVLNSIVQAKVNTTKQDMAIITEALDRYATFHDGQFPNPSSFASGTTLSTILTSGTAATGTSTSFGGPYLQSLPQDAWGNDFYYGTSSGGHTFVLATLASVSGSTMLASAATPATGDSALYVTSSNSTPQTGAFSGTSTSSNITRIYDAGSGN
ncbi:type II secretion system protein GspG [Ferroacidibacillus organovorans]|uniref:Type II secretion system protein GspG C-terminal domain-containing protein n=1 Tax=Ferroacidibacillus organovorans TaxID=1765683 RepID=A0A101XSH1_9BACL|nr:type II secretion system protein GspG [Ferroacidibacillus organovorans]KUO96732.1 hypothetical protein ATW55_07885 [Ferroacidibacillus organovorans]